jgi:hypothetical protein
MLRPPVSLALVVLALLVCPGGVQAAGSGLGQTGEHLSAFLDGQRIPLVDVSLYHCHDIEAPIIRCFRTAAERDDELVQDLRSTGSVGTTSDLSLASILSSQSVNYVLWYAAIDYGGTSMFTSGAISNLGTLGWDNMISSFKSTNGGRPKWWDGTGYTLIAWQWSASAWVAYVGDDANDKFSSVQNVP